MERKDRNQVLTELEGRLKELTVDQLFSKNINASGQLARSVNYTDEILGNGNTGVSIVMEDYGFAIEDGRGGATRKGTQSWKPKVINWMRAKGIRPKQGVTMEQAAYLIYRKINKQGYQAKPFIEPALAAFSAQFANEYAEATANDIELDLKTVVEK
jgi:hypothetical protein